MNQGFITIGMLAGGLGLFLLAVNMITDGLRLAAGHALRDMLGKWTRTPARGIVSGLSITAIVQSSSAVTVATIGFVNAGLITMYQALGVVYGANIGTTMTGWLVAIVGFKIKVEIFALPMIGIGMLLRLTGNDSRRVPLGMALAGFGLFFIGIDVLKDAFEGLAAAIELQKFTVDGIAGVVMYVGIGFLMTVLTQSSSAAIAITLTAATGGMLGLHAAAAMVIGANVGTTSTAALAVIGATPNAKRVAGAHIIFNLATGVVALLILPLLFWIVKITGELLGLQDIPAVTLALFHTTFNILGVLLMWPVSGRLTRFLEKRFVTQEEIEGRPRFLDKTVAVSPMLALNALVLELSRIAAVVRRMSLAALSVESAPGRRITSDHLVVKKLTTAVADFITRLGRASLSSEVADQLAKLLRAEQHLLACAEQTLLVTREQAKLEFVDDAKIMEGITRYRAEVVSLMNLADPQAEGFSFTDCEMQLQQVQVAYDDVKAALLFAGAELRIPIPGMIEILDQNSRIRRMARQMVKAMHYLSEVYTVAEMRTKEVAEVEVREDRI
ncbi:Na/Pi cotransporter family protein [Sulfuriflexus mobilis]|uniref:Na/Pi cotransporter family protein n=1 Tax=Sulfuriflexus mobilis TaxID=1811807 RepID=UPI000F8231CC|nr:Na/Pi cotransporter family protein [Sulfuriflexus mobilis]